MTKSRGNGERLTVAFHNMVTTGYVADYQASSSSDQQFSTDTLHASADEGNCPFILGMSS